MTDAEWHGASSPLGALGRELDLSDDPKSAAILTSLLQHYQETSSDRRSPLYLVLDERISPPEMVCHLGLSAATVWVSASTARAEALAKHDIVMRQVESWTSSLLSTGSEPVVPYISGLQLLLRLCMNSAKSAAVRTSSPLPHEPSDHTHLLRTSTPVEARDRGGCRGLPQPSVLLGCFSARLPSTPPDRARRRC